jgi:Zn-dependent M16 (insulinase) family peptidase
MIQKKNKKNGMAKTLFSLIVTNILCFMAITGFSQPANSHGFKLIEKRFVKEVNADCYIYEHIKSGARLLKVASSDENKTFGIAFKTIPSSDNGIAHIMEHSVLNGSKNFPVKSPFDVLSKGSLKTFLNAFTSKDFTMYPYASMNDKDYFNLMYVYMDAVFNPLIYSDPRILKQEGWHYELTSKDAPVIYKGVVYNEMKGAYSAPTRELSYQVYKNLFPDSPYGWESGGYPSAIPSLTYEEFLNFHKKYYSPENSYIFLYGNADLEKELAFLDEKYLSKYSKTGVLPVINDQKPFLKMKDITASYPAMEGAPTKDQTYLSLSFVAGHNTDYALGMAFDIICEILFNQESAPVRLALEKAGIGQDVSADATNYYQNVIKITVQNANAEDKQKFYDIVMNALKDAVKNGIDKKEIQGIINRYEFSLREGSNSQMGISYLNQIQAGWFFANDPLLGLEYEKTLTTVKAALTGDYFEKIIQKYFIENNHCLLLTLVPQPGLDKEKNAKLEQELKTYKEKLDANAIDALIKETNELIAFQKREDSPVALATIPLLSISDINPKASWYGIEEKQIAGSKVLLHEEFTNNIIYADLNFNLKVLPLDMLPYASLLSNVLGSLSTEKYSYGDLNRELNINTGGFYTSLSTYIENMDDNKLLAYFNVSSKVMSNKVDDMFALASEILYKSVFTDKERLKNILVRHQSQLDASMKSNGYGVAAGRLSSYFMNNGKFNELTAGLDYYWFVTALVKDFDKNSDQIIASLKKVSELLFTKENMIAAATCSKPDYEKFNKGLEVFSKTMASKKPALNDWKFYLTVKNEGILTASKVQYVVMGYDYKKLGYAWNGKMNVLNQIISTDWLKNQIRVIGGAYGGFSNINLTGLVTFNSYRDPNLKTTIENYKATSDYLKKFEADDNSMTRYILGAVSKIDVPMTASQKGDQAISYYFAKRSLDDIQKSRNELLSTKAQDIRDFSKMISDILAKNAVCVYGNTDKINAEKDSFKELIKINP